jgi:predicted nuclease with TOPRIM domain
VFWSSPFYREKNQVKSSEHKCVSGDCKHQKIHECFSVVIEENTELRALLHERETECVLKTDRISKLEAEIVKAKEKVALLEEAKKQELNDHNYGI